MKSPKVTVITPVYNGEKYLHEMMGSILAQTMQDFEFIIINDGSTDGTEEIVKSYDDPRIRYFTNDKNRGIAYSYNRAIDLANGAFLAVAEADDINHPRRLAIQTSYMQANENVGLLCSKQKIFRGSTVQFTKIINPSRITHSAEQNKHGMLFCQSEMRHASVMYRNSTLTEHKVRYDLDYKIAADYAIYTILSPITDMVCLDCFLLHYRIHENNFSRNIATTNSEANKAQQKFFQKEFGFTIQGKLVLESREINLADFAEHIAVIEQVLSHIKKHPNYERNLLVSAAATLGYYYLKAVVRGGINNKQAFHLYQKTPLLCHIDNKKKLRLWAKFLAYHLGIKRK